MGPPAPGLLPGGEEQHLAVYYLHTSCVYCAVWTAVGRGGARARGMSQPPRPWIRLQKPHFCFCLIWFSPTSIPGSEPTGAATSCAPPPPPSVGPSFVFSAPRQPVPPSCCTPPGVATFKPAAETSRAMDRPRGRVALEQTTSRLPASPEEQ